MRRLLLILAVIVALLAPSSAAAITRARAISISASWATGMCLWGVVGSSCVDANYKPAHIAGGPYGNPDAQWVTEGTFTVYNGEITYQCPWELVLGNRGRIRHSWDACTGGTPDAPGP